MNDGRNTAAEVEKWKDFAHENENKSTLIKREQRMEKKKIEINFCLEKILKENEKKRDYF